MKREIELSHRITFLLFLVNIQRAVSVTANYYVTVFKFFHVLTDVFKEIWVVRIARSILKPCGTNRNRVAFTMMNLPPMSFSRQLFTLDGKRWLLTGCSFARGIYNLPSSFGFPDSLFSSSVFPVERKHARL